MNYFEKLRCRILLNKGRNKMEAGKYEDALKPLFRAKQMDELNPIPHYLIGCVKARQDEYKDAIVYLKRSLELQPESSQFAFDLALCYVEVGDYDEAEELFDKLVKNYPQDQSLLVYVTDFYLLTKQYYRGINLIESIPPEELGEAYLVYQLAQLYYEADKVNNKEKTSDLLEEAKEKARYLRDKKLIEEIEEYNTKIH